jgi:hypothetical protein
MSYEIYTGADWLIHEGRERPAPFREVAERFAPRFLELQAQRGEIG